MILHHWLSHLTCSLKFHSANHFGRKSIKADLTLVRYNIWNQSTDGLVWICNSTPFNPLKSNQVVSITPCSHLRLQAVYHEMLPLKKKTLCCSFIEVLQGKQIVKGSWVESKHKKNVNCLMSLENESSFLQGKRRYSPSMKDSSAASRHGCD